MRDEVIYKITYGSVTAQNILFFRKQSLQLTQVKQVSRFVMIETLFLGVCCPLEVKWLCDPITYFYCDIFVSRNLLNLVTCALAHVFHILKRSKKSLLTGECSFGCVHLAP